MLDDSYPSSKDNISWSFEKGRIKPRLFGFLVALVIFISSFLVTIVSISTGRENRIGEDLRPLKWLPKPSLTVDLGYVKYAGLHDNVAGIWRYRGIPYAVSPGGELRWQPPRNIESKNDFYGKTIVADTAGPLCHQICNPGVWCGRYEGQSEDCLMLDVLVPEHPVSKRLPVVVMIHGGGFTTGSVLSAPGDALVHYSKGNIIFVTIQYRLGIFGFLAGSEIRSNGVANAGLLDQRCALEWIQRHILSFGGDPSKVTIWGGSAGGSSVIHQIGAFGGAGNVPFRAAIPECPWHSPMLNSSTQEVLYRAAIGLAGCTSLQCLRDISSIKLQDVNSDLFQLDEFSSVFGLLPYGPVVDDDFIRELPSQAFKEGRFHKVPTLINHNKHEGFIFSSPKMNDQVQETSDAKVMFPFAGPSFFSRLYQLYPIDQFNNTFWQRQTWFGDFIINCPTYNIASSMVDHVPNSIFKMLFNAGNEHHGATGPFLQSTNINYPQADNHTLAEIMSAYWISFILTTNPNPLRAENAPVWQSYARGGQGNVDTGESIGFEVLTIEHDDIYMERDRDASDRCDFFLANSAVIRG